MKSKDVLIWMVVLVAVIGGLSLWWASSRPSASEASNKARVLKILPNSADLDKAFAEIEGKKMNGLLPVSPVPPTPPRGDPFSV